MIGHDLVDISLARHAHRWDHPDFLKKIFDAGELAILHSDGDVFERIWWFWSQKEAAYKIANRLTGRRWFNPHSFKISGIEAESTVAFAQRQFCVRTSLEGDKIESIAVTHRTDFNRVTATEIGSIFKRNGLPFYQNCEGVLEMASLSHHGKYTSAYRLLNS